MAYEREAQTDIADLKRQAALLTEASVPAGYEREAQSDVRQLQRLVLSLPDADSFGGYERVGRTDVAALRRKLRSGGPPFDPSTIAGLKLWLKADSLALADGAAMTSWADSSANGYNLTAGTATFKTNIVNGKPVVRFNGTSNNLFSTVNISVPQPNSIFVVAKTVLGPGNEYFIGTDLSFLLGLSTSGFFFVYAGTGPPIGSINRTGAFHVFTAINASGLTNTYVDGAAEIAGGSIGPSALGKINIMSDYGATSFSLGDFAEMLIYNSALGTTDRSNVEGCLKPNTQRHDMSDDNKHVWVGIGKQVLSFVVGVIAAAFVLGSARQRVSDLTAWKTKTEPRIERMDSQGTLSFELFHKEYERTQARQEKKLEELEKEVKELDKKLDP